MKYVLLQSSDDDNDEDVDDGNDEEADEENDGLTDNTNHEVEDEEDEAGDEEVMEDIVEDQESSQMQYPEQSDGQAVTQRADRGGGNSVVPEFGELTATSSERLPTAGGSNAQETYRLHAPPESSSATRVSKRGGQEAQTSSHQFEDDREDSVVPSTPKLSEGLAHSSRGVPGSSTSGLGVISENIRSSGGIAAVPREESSTASTFIFRSTPVAGTSTENLVSSDVSSSSNRGAANFGGVSSQTGVSDLASQEGGLDRTSVDIAQFAAGLVSQDQTPNSVIRAKLHTSSAVSSSPRPAHRASPSTSTGNNFKKYHV